MLIEVKKNTWIDSDRIGQIEYNPLHQAGPRLTIKIAGISGDGLVLDEVPEIEEAAKALESVGIKIKVD
jgi:hypothetical protein